MIISRTPFRMSFLGGGTDYPAWFNEHGGAVLVTAIDKYCYVMLHDGKAQSVFDLPTKSGLGTSSAYTVGLLRVCTELECKTIAKLATVWEQDKLGGNIGSQDQYICSLGGFRHLRFDADTIRDVELDYELVKPLESMLMLFDTHQRRKSGDIVAHQLENMSNTHDILMNMMAMVDDGLELLQKRNYTDFGNLLQESWYLKRKLSPYVSTLAIDAIYDTAVKAGASGGKLLGAGGGGFMLFFCEPEKQGAVRNALSDLNHVPFKFEREGTKIIHRD